MQWYGELTIFFSPQNIACVMGYIVDLTIIIRLLSISHRSSNYTSGAIEEEAVGAIKEYISSGNLSEVHNRIRKFVSEKNMLWFIDGRDLVLEEIECLIKEFCNVPQLPAFRDLEDDPSAQVRQFPNFHVYITEDLICVAHHRHHSKESRECPTRGCTCSFPHEK